MKHFLASVWEIVEVVLIALISVFVIRTFVVQPFLVSGASMAPTFKDGNYLLVDEMTYYFRAPTRGEVVVFHYPANPKQFFIKRLIGLPGETVVIHANTVTITPANGEKSFELKEPYLSSQVRTMGEVNIQLKENEYFVLGDNRSNSFDSRNWGPLPEDDVIGLVRLRIYPFNDFGAFRTPAYAF